MDPPPTEIYTLSLHDALPISRSCRCKGRGSPSEQLSPCIADTRGCRSRSEEHTSELQSRQYLVCRLLLEKKKKSIMIKCAANIRHMMVPSESRSWDTFCCI